MSAKATARRPARASALRAPAPLRWETLAPRLLRANVAGGIYVAVANSLGAWTGEWRPVRGRVKALLIQVPQQLALDACARHNLGRCTDAFLDDANLAAPAGRSRLRDERHSAK